MNSYSQSHLIRLTPEGPASVQRLAIVCFEDPRRPTGGVQRRIAAEVAYFARCGVEVVVITEGNGAREIEGPVTYINVPTPRVAYPLRTLVFSARASRYLRCLPSFDVVETHHDAGAAALLAWKGGRLAHGVWVEFIHGVFRDEFAAVRRHERLSSRATLAASGLLPLALIEQTAARRATAVVTVSDYTAGLIERSYGVPRRQIHVIPNGIDTGRYAPPARRPARDGCEILYVGRWHARKGVMQLLRAFAFAHAVDRRLRLKLAGAGPLGPALRTESDRLGVSGAVEFLGGLDDAAIIDAYRAADIVCVPSLQEGQGIVALEAQACGAPVVATRAGGLAETVRDHHTGLLVPPGDSAALASAILELAHDEALRCELGRNAAGWASSFAWGRMLTKSAALYAELFA